MEIVGTAPDARFGCDMKDNRAPRCRVPHNLTAVEREWLALELGDDFESVSPANFFHGAGCDQCRGTGYKGRTGVYEMIEMTPELVHAAGHSDPSEFMRMARLKFAEHSLRADGVRLACAGRTTAAEAMRVTNQT